MAVVNNGNSKGNTTSGANAKVGREPTGTRERMRRQCHITRVQRALHPADPAHHTQWRRCAHHREQAIQRGRDRDAALGRHARASDVGDDVVEHFGQFMRLRVAVRDQPLGDTA